MIKTVRKTFCWFVVGMMMVTMSCSDDKTSTAPDDEGLPFTKGVVTESFYAGDLYGEGTGNFWINFVTEGMSFDEENQTYIGPGSILCIDFNSVKVVDADYAQPETGSYITNVGATHATFSLNFDSDTLLNTFDKDGKSTVTEFKSGTMDLVCEKGVYTIECKFITTDDKEFAYSYRGKIVFINRTEEGVMSNLRGDMVLDKLTQGAMINYGNGFTPTSDACAVILAGADYDLQTNFGNSDAITLFFHVTPGAGATRKIPAGKYTVFNGSTAEDYPVFGLMSGFYDKTYGGYYGAWFFSTTSKIEASLRSGTVDVLENANGTQTFTILLKDGHDYTVSGTYTGTLKFADATN